MAASAVEPPAVVPPPVSSSPPAPAVTAPVRSPPPVTTPPAQPPVSEAQPAPAPRVAPPAPTPTPVAPEPARGTTRPEGAAARARPSPLPSSSSNGAPDAGAQQGHDVATPPSAPASTPRLNLDFVRPRGGELSREGTRGVLELLPRPPERKSKLAEEIEKSARPDCRNAYSSMGVLGAAPLAADALKAQGGCRW